MSGLQKTGSSEHIKEIVWMPEARQVKGEQNLDKRMNRDEAFV